MTSPYALLAKRGLDCGKVVVIVELSFRGFVDANGVNMRVDKMTPKRRLGLIDGSRGWRDLFLSLNGGLVRRLRELVSQWHG